MVEQKLRDFFKTAEPPPVRQIEEIHAQIDSGLGIMKALIGKIDASVIREIEGEIALSAYFSAIFLGLPGVPCFGLTYGWRDDSSKGPKDASGRLVLANAHITPEYPSGLISFAPEFLKTVGEYKMGSEDERVVRIAKDSPVDCLTAHESFHIKQEKKFRNRMKVEAALRSTSDSKDWDKTRPERAARLFEKAFRDASNVYVSEGTVYDLKTHSIKRI